VFGKRSNSAAGNNELVPTAPAPRLQTVSPAPAAAQPRPDSAASPPVIVEGGRSPIPAAGLGAPLVSAPAPSRRAPGAAGASSPPLAPTATDSRHTESYYETKSMVFGALIEAIDLAQLAKLDADSSREEIRDIVNEIIAIKAIVLSISEQEELLDDICNDVLGYGPLEPLLARDDIADTMRTAASVRL
jgi:pilus assembly protein CpaF